MYATVPDLRDEGVTESMASDSRLSLLLDEATRLIDRVTGWFFEPKELSLRLHGRGTPTVETAVPLISMNRLTIEGAEVFVDSETLIVEGAPIQPGFSAPRLTLRNGIFPRDPMLILADGTWGYTEDDGTPTGRTPLEIRRACLMLALRNLPQLSDQDAVSDVRNQWRIVSEKTRDQSYTLAAPNSTATVTGDPEVDGILVRYRKPMGLGAV